MGRVVVPIDLGGSPTRCILAPPNTARPTPELVTALIEHYQAERAKPGDHMEVGFFRGGIPGPDLIAACGDLPIRL